MALASRKVLCNQRVRAAPQVSTKVSRTSRLVCNARTERLPGKQLGNNTIILSSGKHTCNQTTPKSADPATDLNAYMYSLSQDFGILQMPMGASLHKLGGGGYEIIVPKISILDVWFQPKALAAVRIAQPPNKRMELFSNTALLEGSHHVTDLKLNEVFNMDVKVAFTWQDGSAPGTQPTIFSEASIDVDVDIPFPFSALPRPALEMPGNAAFSTTLDIMLNGFVSSLVEDYKRWAASPALRAERQAKVTASANV